jgi:hypothetical protein
MTAHDLMDKLEFLQREEFEYLLLCKTPHGSYQFNLASLAMDHDAKQVVLVMQETGATEPPNESERLVSVPVPVLLRFQEHFQGLAETVEELDIVAGNLVSGAPVHLPLGAGQ